MKKYASILSVLCIVSMAWGNVWGYGYPLVNPYEATVIGTPMLYRPELPEEIDQESIELKLFEDRVAPDVLWYEKKLRCSLVYQKWRAPLIFLIAGTGASHESGNMKIMQRAFFGAGFHVFSISSPTHPNFIVTASTTGVPGLIRQDALDLYRVMKKAMSVIEDRIEVTDYYLTGYSLGAAQAAFVSKLDEDRGRFGFKRVLMINPPVSLYNSVVILDEMLEKNIPGGPENFNAFFREMMQKFADIYRTTEGIDFNNDFLYNIFKAHPPGEEILQALIGVSFRLSSTNMIFAADVLNHTGLIVPPNLHLSAADSLTEYFIVTNRTSFQDYFEELFYPFFRERLTGITRQGMIDSVSLESIRAYLEDNPKIGVMHNQDDIILAPGEIDFFKEVFGSRAKIYPNGGHCGNMAYSENVEYMIRFFEQ